MNNIEEQKKDNYSDINDFKELLEKNLQKNEEIIKIALDVKKYMKWQQIWSILRFLLIFVPIILGFIYLPPLIKDLFVQYQGLLK